ncbi:MAG: twin-arginine translocase subunit TatC [Actinomycetota bacterium]|jgi:sec-independent protein translocase protein TatC|nr:twin-arginine translocase subunit TatC [Actinomycetota bacterium]
MPLVDHLSELRRRLIISVVALVGGAIVGFILYNRILGVLVRPYAEVTNNPDANFVFFDPLEAFATRLKVAAWSGAFLASPVVLWQLWRFITPGLHKNEKRYAIPFIVSSILLFVLGGFVALYTFESALRFLVGVGGPELTPLFSASKFLSLIILMIIAFGIAFEFPVLLVCLELAGVLTSATLRKWRRPALVVIVAVAAVITPSQDPYSLFAMVVPMYIFYEGAILIGRLLKK